MTWAGWGNWYPKPERNKASRMSCAAAKAHAMQCTRWHGVGDDWQGHVVGTDAAICGRKIIGIPLSDRVFNVCEECLSILAEIERITA